jgi:hypothetical protein
LSYASVHARAAATVVRRRRRLAADAIMTDDAATDDDETASGADDADDDDGAADDGGDGGGGDDADDAGDDASNATTTTTTAGLSESYYHFMPYAARGAYRLQGNVEGVLETCLPEPKCAEADCDAGACKGGVYSPDRTYQYPNECSDGYEGYKCADCEKGYYKVAVHLARMRCRVRISDA